jgi:hypothetical protein
MFAMLASGSVVFGLGCVDLIGPAVGPAVGPVGPGARDEGNRMTAPQSSKCRARARARRSLQERRGKKFSAIEEFSAAIARPNDRSAV